MKKLVFLLIFLLITLVLPGHAETNGPGKNYCREETSWHDWHALLEKILTMMPSTPCMLCALAFAPWWNPTT